MPKGIGKKKAQAPSTPASTPAPQPAPMPARVSAPFAPGDRIVHPTFGEGKVVAIDGVKLEIAFNDAGTRIIRNDFVKRRSE